MSAGEDYCCGGCFGDWFLDEQIAWRAKGRRGRCSYCEVENATLVNPEELSDWFELLVSIYEPNANGATLFELLKADWDLFHHPRIDRFRAERLLARALGDHELIDKRYAPRAEYALDNVTPWEKLREELMYANRYFPSARLDERLKTEHLEQLLEPDVARIWYRARLMTEESPFPPERMSAPPARYTTHGRANPAGIPYLYLGSTAQTAASEVRPHAGETACVANFTIEPEKLQLIDLRSPRRKISPFKLATVEEIGQLRCNVSLLERLGEELTTPILPQSAAIDYVPSQYLCEFIKKQGFDGVLYRSSVSEGVNLALFDPGRAEVGAVALYAIDAVRVTLRAKESAVIGVEQNS